MCRSIRPLRVAEPPTTDGDVRAAALQYVRKVSGSRTLPRRNAAAFEAAIGDVAAATARLLAALGTLPVPGEATPPALWPRPGRRHRLSSVEAQDRGEGLARSAQSLGLNFEGLKLRGSSSKYRLQKSPEAPTRA